MNIQNNYVLGSTDSDGNTRVQLFTEYEDAYKAMETEHKAMMSALGINEDEADDDTYIEKNSAHIYGSYGETLSWIIKKTFVQTPEMAEICRQYDEMIAEGEKGSSFRNMKRSTGFCCPFAEANVNACYASDKGILYFTVCFMPFSDQKKFVPYETYKWCVERGIQKVSNADEANRILYEIDATASFITQP